MKRRLIQSLIFALTLFASTAFLRAEVKTEEKNQMKFEGMMGRMMGLFGGKAAKEGVINTIAVKGNRMMTTSESTGQLIDLSEQKVYNIDFKKKTYEVMTFEEMRRRLQESQEKAEKAAKDSARADAKDDQPSSDQQMEYDFSLKESGQKRTINNYDCREVIMTITARQKGKTLEDGGGMVMTSHIWLGPNIPAVKEIEEFNKRYAEAMGNTFGMGSSAEQMAMASAMYPGMKAMIGKMQGESVNMEGAQILNEMTIESVKSAAQAAQEQKQDNESSGGVSSMGGLGGMLGRRLARKKAAEGDANKPAGRATILTVNHELLKVDADVPDTDVAIPAGFKVKK